MSNSIWKTPDKLHNADTHKQILFYAGGGQFLYLGWNHPALGMILAGSADWKYSDIQKWCYLDDLIAQADKAERLQKAVDLAVDVLQKAKNTRELTVKGIYVHTISLDELHSALKEIKQLIKETTNDADTIPED